MFITAVNTRRDRAIGTHRKVFLACAIYNFLFCAVHVQCNYLMQELCDAANEEVDENERVQIANFLCPVSVLSDAVGDLVC